MEELIRDEQPLAEPAMEAESDSILLLYVILYKCVMFQYCSVELTGEYMESTGVVAKNLSASWSSDKEKITISDISFQVDQVCTTLLP